MTPDPHKAYVTSAFQYLAEVGVKLERLSDAEISALRKSGDLHSGPKLRLTLQGFRNLDKQLEIRASHEQA